MRKLTELPVAELVELARASGPEASQAWAALVSRHVGFVWKVVRCFDMSQDAAWEAYQSTWLRVIERLDSVQDPERFSSWLATVARREALGVLRSRRRLVPSEDIPERPDDAPPLGDDLHRDELRRAVGSIGPTRRRCLDKLRQSAPLTAYLQESDR